MTQQDERSDGNLRALLEQQWLHCRHLESERAWLLNVYGIVTGGTLAYVASGTVTPSPLFYFLIVLTFFGFFHTLRWIYAFECHREKVNSLARIIWSESGVKSMLDPTMDIPPMDIAPSFIITPSFEKKEIAKRLQKQVNEIFRTRYWFPFFYFIILVGFAIFFFKIPALSKGVAITASVLACLAFFLGVRWHSSLKKIKKKISS